MLDYKLNVVVKCLLETERLLETLKDSTYKLHEFWKTKVTPKDLAKTLAKTVIKITQQEEAAKNLQRLVQSAFDAAEIELETWRQTLGDLECDRLHGDVMEATKYSLEHISAALEYCFHCKHNIYIYELNKKERCIRARCMW
uniref:Rx_N domain-containing protein n=1 Tax=Panagrellus redivivus TaxID=6233 RepID=A0A7E4VLU4_PANRE